MEIIVLKTLGSTLALSVLVAILGFIVEFGGNKDVGSTISFCGMSSIVVHVFIGILMFVVWIWI